MLTERLVAEAVRAADIEAPVRFLEVTGSTNSDLLRMAQDGAPDWTVVVANQQKAGRGRLGRAWVSAPGSSLLCSVLLRPRLEPRDAPLLTLAAGVAMARACAEVCAVAARCKWPNDLVVGERKLGGVLVEASVREGEVLDAVIGVGVNLTLGRDEFPPELRDRATSIVLEGARPDPGPLLTVYLRQLQQLSQALRQGSREHLLDPYREISATIGRRVKATTTDGAEVTGRAVGVGASGELLVETPTGVAPVGFGEIGHLG